MRKHIPNLLTISNLICGCLALFYSFHNNLIASACLIGIASIFDFMDGFVARMLNESSPIGKELDSLADLVSFGLVPGSVIFHLIDTSYLHTYSFIALAIPIFQLIGWLNLIQIKDKINILLAYLHQQMP